MVPVNKTNKHTFTVVIGSDRKVRLLTSNTVLEGSMIHAITTRRFGANRKSLQGKAIVNDVNFDAAFIGLKQKSEDVWENVPVEHIEKATNVMPHVGYPVNLKDIDWNTSFLEIAEGVALDAGKVFEFTIWFTPNK